MTTPICRVCLAALVLLMTGVAPAQENLTFRPPSDWERGSPVQQTRDQLILEYVKKGEKIDSWTELLTMQQFRRKGSPREFFDQLKGTRERACPGLTEWRMVRRSATPCSTSGIRRRYAKANPFSGRWRASFLLAIPAIALPIRLGANSAQRRARSGLIGYAACRLDDDTGRDCPRTGRCRR
jgi:hypothetical protein